MKRGYDEWLHLVRCATHRMSKQDAEGVARLLTEREEAGAKNNAIWHVVSVYFNTPHCNCMPCQGANSEYVEPKPGDVVQVRDRRDGAIAIDRAIINRIAPSDDGEGRVAFLDVGVGVPLRCVEKWRQPA